MMFKVLHPFVDLTDGNHLYVEGSSYPRVGYTPTEARISELCGSRNKIGIPLICEEAKGEPEKQQPKATAKPQRRKKGG